MGQDEVLFGMAGKGKYHVDVIWRNRSHDE
jgi:hypothetical protein